MKHMLRHNVSELDTKKSFVGKWMQYLTSVSTIKDGRIEE